jgi:hypothetical protein
MEAKITEPGVAKEHPLAIKKEGSSPTPNLTWQAAQGFQAKSPSDAAR